MFGAEVGVDVSRETKESQMAAVKLNEFTEGEVYCLLEALDHYARSCKSSQQRTKNPQLLACYNAQLRSIAELSAKLNSRSVIP